EPAGRGGLPEGRHAPRPAGGGRRRAGGPLWPGPRYLRVPDAARDPSRGAATPGRPGRADQGLPALRRGKVRLPDAPDGRAPGEPAVLPAIAGDHRMSTIAMLGAGVMGGTLVSALVRAGQDPSDLVVSDRTSGRGREL